MESFGLSECPKGNDGPQDCWTCQSHIITTSPVKLQTVGSRSRAARSMLAASAWVRKAVVQAVMMRVAAEVALEVFPVIGITPAAFRAGT